jgi:DNA repair protein RecO (recombination protein O)
MEERSTGLVLRTRPLTDTSLIVQWLTKDFGRISTVAKGARRPNSTFRGKLDLFFAAQFSFVRSRRSDLHTLREVKVHSTNLAIRNDITLLQQASYFVALIELATESETPIPEIFDLLNESLLFLSEGTTTQLTLITFEIKLLQLIGLSPDDQNTPELSAGSRQILQRCGEFSWAQIRNLKAAPPQLNELNNFLKKFLLFHLEKVPGTRESAWQSS